MGHELGARNPEGEPSQRADEILLGREHCVGRVLRRGTVHASPERRRLKWTAPAERLLPRGLVRARGGGRRREVRPMPETSLRPPAAVAVLGAGNMGSGIAQACAQAGFQVRVRDVDHPSLQKGRERIEKMLAGAIERKKMTPARRDDVLARITFTTELGRGGRRRGLGGRGGL